MAALLLVGLLPVVSGCVAAAVPLAAGAALMRGRSQAADPVASPPAAQASAASDLKVTRLALTALPPPDPAAAARHSAMAALRDYALAQLATPPSAGQRPSALLSRASHLRADRASCTAMRPAVFVDLDPGRGTFDPLAPGRPDSALATTLAELRANNVTVVWFSRLGAGFADATRTALAEAGMDPRGSDELILLSTLDERKQTRRDEVAKRLCPIALVGDERADFDELYLYLKQPDAAIALDAMIGRGWFLTRPFDADAAPAAAPTKP
jgi:hypothetical protein